MKNGWKNYEILRSKNFKKKWQEGHTKHDKLKKQIYLFINKMGWQRDEIIGNEVMMFSV